MRRLAGLFSSALLTPLLMSPALLTGCQGNSNQDIPPAMQQVALQLPQTDGPLVLHVRSDGFEPGQEMADLYSGTYDNISPSLGWSGVPEAAKSITILMEDPDAPKPKPFTHWIVYNIPATDERIRQNVPKEPELTQPAGALQGTNAAGKIGYTGPMPPKGDPPHHYHFQVFALDRMLPLKAGATRQEVIAAMAGHVVAKGEIVGTYRER